MTRYKLTIEYKGSDYAGWQRQPDVPSIQAAIETAITAFCGQEVTLTVAGRTDGGVHARGQIAHVDFEEFKKQHGNVQEILDKLIIKREYFIPAST